MTPAFDFGPPAFDVSKLMLKSLSWSHGGDHIKVLGARFRAVLIDGVQQPGSVPGLSDCRRWRVWPGLGLWMKFCIYPTLHSLRLVIASHESG